MRNINYKKAKMARPAYIVCWVWGQLEDEEKQSVLSKLEYVDEFDVKHSHPRWYWVDRIIKNATGDHWRGINEEWIETLYVAFDGCIGKKDLKDWIHDRRRLYMEGKRKLEVGRKKAAVA